MKSELIIVSASVSKEAGVGREKLKKHGINFSVHVEKLIHKLLKQYKIK